jgi:hypothetical protein
VLFSAGKTAVLTEILKHLSKFRLWGFKSKAVCQIFNGVPLCQHLDLSFHFFEDATGLAAILIIFKMRMLHEIAVDGPWGSKLVVLTRFYMKFSEVLRVHAIRLPEFDIAAHFTFVVTTSPNFVRFRSTMEAMTGASSL